MLAQAATEEDVDFPTIKSRTLVTVLSDLPNQPAPLIETDHPESQGVNRGRLQVIWNQALEQLSAGSAEEKSHAHTLHHLMTISKGHCPDGNVDGTQILETLQDLAKKRQDAASGLDCHLTLLGRQWELKDVLERIVKFLNRFKEVGDVVASFDPQHAALPWAVVRFLLQASIFPCSA